MLRSAGKINVYQYFTPIKMGITGYEELPQGLHKAPPSSGPQGYPNALHKTISLGSSRGMAKLQGAS